MELNVSKTVISHRFDLKRILLVTGECHWHFRTYNEYCLCLKHKKCVRIAQKMSNENKSNNNKLNDDMSLLTCDERPYNTNEFHEETLCLYLRLFFFYWNWNSSGNTQYYIFLSLFSNINSNAFKYFRLMFIFSFYLFQYEAIDSGLFVSIEIQI